MMIFTRLFNTFNDNLLNTLNKKNIIKIHLSIKDVNILKQRINKRGR